MKNPLGRLSMDIKIHDVFIGLSVVVAGIFVSCEEPLADEQNLSAANTRSGKNSSLSKGKASDSPQPPELLVTGLQGGSGSTIGPDNALYIAENAVGRISRVDPETGAVTTFATGLPAYIVGIGGIMDIAFIGETCYALVTLVGPQFGSSDVVGIYRIDGPNSATVIADIGAFAIANPPSTAYFVTMGVQYAMENYRGGFLVTDGHHNRVLHVTFDGEISVFKAFPNIVPTGLDVMGNRVYMSQAGPIPHLPENGKVVSIDAKSSGVATVASGARLVVDVEFGRGQTLFALSQGIWDGVEEGTPAEPNTGSLFRVNGDGTFSVVTTGLDRPTSLEIIQNTAYIVSLAGQVWKIEDVASPPYGTFASNGN